MTNHYLLIDIASKQSYIFSSNKLKENVGANHVIAHEIFKVLIPKHYKKSGNNVLASYGGGSAILTFDNKQKLQNFVSGLSEKLLRDYPGISLELGCADDDNGNKSFSKIRDELYGSKQRRRNRNHFETRTIDMGLAARCRSSGFPANASLDLNVEVDAKQKLAQASNNKLIGDLGIDEKVFTFSTKIEDLITDDTNGYKAVVHVDGNKLGAAMSGDLDRENYEIQNQKIRTKLDGCMKELIGKLIPLIDSRTGKMLCANNHIEINLKMENGKWVLPIRPIVNAGDDITFICHGRLGIYLAEQYIKILADPEIGDMSVSSCAGVAIVHTKYPFYKAYELCNELCDSAKADSRSKIGEDANRIQYMISSSGFTGDLDKIIEDQFTAAGHELKGQSYSISEFDRLKQLSADLAFTKNSKWPRNKMMQLKTLLSSSDEALEYHIEESIITAMAVNKNIKDVRPTCDMQINRAELYEAIEIIDFFFHPK